MTAADYSNLDKILAVSDLRLGMLRADMAEQF